MAGLPGPGYGPTLPLPGGRDGEGSGEREARRLAARLAVAQRRLGQPSPPVQMPTTPVLEEIIDGVAVDDPAAVRGVLRRIGILLRASRDPR